MMIKIREIKNNAKRLSVHIEKEQITERKLLKQHIAGRMYHHEYAYWSIPYTKSTLSKLDDIFGKNYRLCFSINKNIPEFYDGPFYLHNFKTTKKEKPKKETVLKYVNAIDALEQSLILKRYSYATIKSYKYHLKQLLYYYNEHQPSKLTITQIKNFIYHKVKNENIAERTQNQLINALKYFYEKVVGRDKMFIEIERPKIPKDLPHYLSPKRSKTFN